MRDLDSLGPVCNPDGSPSDVTKAMLAGTGRDPVAFAASSAIAVGITPTVYLSCADTAKLIRTALRDAFPGVTFSVRSKVYSGGSSINVRWVDGPSTRDVKAITDGYAGRDFDPMIDLGFSVTAVVDARGRIVGHKSPGSSGSRGIFDPIDDPIPPGGRLVHFGAGYVFADRDLSPAVKARADDLLRARGYDPRAPWDVPRYVYDQAVDAALAGGAA